MKKFYLTFALLLCCVFLFAYSRTYTYYKGTIGKLPVEMTLWNSDSLNDIGGFYHYTGQRGMLELAGQYDATGSFSMKEMLNDRTVYPPPITGSFSGKYVQNVLLDGIWKNMDGTKTFPFHLVKSETGGAKLKEGRSFLDSAFVKENGDTIVTENCDIKYIEVAYGTAGVQKKINKSLFYHLSPEVPYNGIDTPAVATALNYNEVTRNFAINSWNEASDELDEDSTISSIQWSFDWETQASVTWNGSGVLCISVQLTEYFGGNRPYIGDYSYCYNLATGDSISLNQVFLPGYKKPLSVLIKKHISNDGPEELGDEPIPVSRNFSLTPFGIEFYYNISELGGYATGGGESFIPWNELNQWIDPKGPMGWVKK